MSKRTANPRIIEVKLRGLVLGECEQGNPTIIRIDPRQCPKEYLDTLIHEMLHFCFPQMAEHMVIRAARKISKVLWKQGYRRMRL